MKVSNAEWRARLIDKMPSQLAEELDIFETEIALKKQGKIDDKVFAETRLRRLSSTVGSEAWNSRDLKSRPH